MFGVVPEEEVLVVRGLRRALPGLCVPTFEMDAEGMPVERFFQVVHRGRTVMVCLTPGLQDVGEGGTLHEEGAVRYQHAVEHLVRPLPSVLRQGGHRSPGPGQQSGRPNEEDA